MITLASFNIRAGFGMENSYKLQRAIDKISTINADFIALQEVDVNIPRSEHTNIPKTIAEAVNMHYVFGKAIDYAGGEYGIALLSKQAPISTKKVLLPGLVETRALIISEFESAVVCATHFSLHEEFQLQAVDIIRNELCGKYDKPVYIMGDFNATPDSATITKLKDIFTILTDTTIPTFPADNPRICIDYIMCLKENADKVDVVETYTDDDKVASDHVYISIKVKK